MGHQRVDGFTVTCSHTLSPSQARGEEQQEAVGEGGGKGNKAPAKGQASDCTFCRIPTESKEKGRRRGEQPKS